MEMNGRNGSWTKCYYNRFNHTKVIASLGSYRLSIFMGIFWPLLAVIIGFSLFEYVKKLKTEKTKNECWF